MSFEWRTDEDEGWAEDVKPKETAVSQSFWFRRRWFLLVMLLALAGVWAAAQWQIRQRVAAATREVETELLATHNFLLQTAVSRDEDLFSANLSGRNPDWVAVQKTLLHDGLLLDRPELGWQHEPQTSKLSPQEVQFQFAPDLQAAELRYPQDYAVQLPSGATETVTLLQTAVYRQGSTRWLYSPPYDEFWGDWVTRPGEQITLVYSQREAEVAERLASDLDGLLAQMCREVADLNCGDGLRLHLRLDREPESLLESSDVEALLAGGLRLNLPSPTLLGLPTDETGYQAVYRAYGVQVATAVLAHQINYDCCRHQLFFRALRDYQLAQLGLQVWPLEPTTYSQILARGFDGDALRHWTRRWQEAPPQFLQVWVVEALEPSWQQVYMLIEFLNQQETAVSPTQMMRLMDRNSYDRWLSDVLSGNYSEAAFETEFLEYIYAQSQDGQISSPPIPLPNGRITLICNNYTNGLSNQILTYDIASRTWGEKFLEYAQEGYLNTVDGENFVVTEYGFYDDLGTTNNIYLVTNEGRQLLEEVTIPSGVEHWITYYIWDETAEYLVRYEYDQGEWNIALRSFDCPVNGCPEVNLNGMPSLSPDNQHMLVSNFPDVVSGINPELQNELLVMTVDGQRQYALGLGGAPFWISNNFYGFVRMGEDGWEVVTANLAKNDPHVVLRKADILAELPADARPFARMVNQIVANPQNPRQLLLQVQSSYATGPNTPSHVFRITLAPDFASVTQIELLRTDKFSGAVGFSPDGRYIITGDYGINNLDIVWYLLDQETGETAVPLRGQGYSIPWSPDGQWYVQNTNNYLLLHAPAYDYQYFIPRDGEECGQVILSIDE